MTTEERDESGILPPQKPAGPPQVRIPEAEAEAMVCRALGVETMPEGDMCAWAREALDKPTPEVSDMLTLWRRVQAEIEQAGYETLPTGLTAELMRTRLATPRGIAAYIASRLRRRSGG